MMVTAIRVSMSGGNQSASGTKPKAEAIKRDRMAHGERGHDDDERPQLPERDHQAEQEQQMVGAVQDVPEPGHDKTQSGVVPARIEPNQAGIAMKLECARDAVGRHEAQRGGHLLTKAVDARVDGEFGMRGADRVFEQDIEQLLVPVELQIVREPRPLHVRARLIVRARTIDPTASDTRA